MNTSTRKGLPHYSITIDDDVWEAYPSSDDLADGDGRSKLLTTIHVNGCPLHLEAHAVRWERGGSERMRDDEGDVQESDGEDSEFHVLNDAFEVNAAQQTVTIRGRQYVLFAHAFGE
jgi:hypothetical protein